MKEQLCISCTEINSCWFKTEVDKTLKDMPPVEDQTPIKLGVNITEEAVDADRIISELRNQARDILECPNVNTVNPRFPGI